MSYWPTRARPRLSYAVSCGSVTICRVRSVCRAIARPHADLSRYAIPMPSNVYVASVY